MGVLGWGIFRNVYFEVITLSVCLRYYSINLSFFIVAATVGHFFCSTFTFSVNLIEFSATGFFPV